MTNSNAFDWDKYIAKTSYDKVLDGLEFARLLIPTMFSPCKEYIYLKSLDLSFKVDDFESLKQALNDCQTTLKHRLSEFKKETSFGSIEKLYILKVDFIVLSKLVSNNSKEDGIYHPEAIFNEE